MWFISYHLNWKIYSGVLCICGGRTTEARASAPQAPGCRNPRFNGMGTVLAVRPYCHTDHYWQVYFETNRVIAETFEAAAIRYPMWFGPIAQGRL